MSKKIPGIPIKFRFYNSVSSNAENTVLRTVEKIYNKTKKNKQFFDNLNIDVCKSFLSLKKQKYCFIFNDLFKQR